MVGDSHQPGRLPEHAPCHTPQIEISDSSGALGFPLPFPLGAWAPGIPARPFPSGNGLLMTRDGHIINK